jgi:ubiquinone biosynthesis protein
MLVSNIAFTLDPKLEFTKEVEPYLKKLIAEDVKNPENMQKRVLDAKARLEDISRVPQQLSSILEMASEGKLRIDIATKEIDELRVTIESSIDRLVIGMLVSAIVIGLSLVLMNQPVEERYYSLLIYIVTIIVIVIILYKMKIRKLKQEY